MASDTQRDGFCLAGDLLGNKGSLFLARAMSPFFLLTVLLERPSITWLPGKQAEKGSVHAELCVTTVSSSKQPETSA